MKSGFTYREVCPGVLHITDPLGVHMTLLVGRQKALLFDTGYGVGNLLSFIGSLTDLPLTTVLSHGHHDHAMGAMHFPSVRMLAEDLPVFRKYTGRGQRERILRQAGLKAQAREQYLSAAISEPDALEEDCFYLDGLSARVLRVPGHTPGSIALLVPERELLLLGDSWNRETWLFFPESLPVRTYAASFRFLMSHPFKKALAPHVEETVDREYLLQFERGLNEAGFAEAKPAIIPGHEHIQVRAFEPCPGARLVFRA